MNKELDIAAILRDKPKGTKLWSPIVGECELGDIDSNSTISVRLNAKIYYGNRALHSMEFDSEGKFGGEFKDNIVEREPTLFPSKAMPDWSKFAWKKGDVLLAGVDNFCIFDSWAKDDYTEFNAKYVTPNYSSAVLETKGWTKVERDDIIKDYIVMIEEIKCGKLNLETLEIEKPNPQFKDGDILCYDGINDGTDITIVYKDGGYANETLAYASFFVNPNTIVSKDDIIYYPTHLFRLATEEEKQQLFDALSKESKTWDAEKKAIVDLPKKHVFKPFEKVLVRDNDEDCVWNAAFFSHKEGKYFVTTDFHGWQQCAPYNDQTAHLLGTTDDWEGGENG